VLPQPPDEMQYTSSDVADDSDVSDVSEVSLVMDTDVAEVSVAYDVTDREDSSDVTDVADVGEDGDVTAQTTLAMTSHCMVVGLKARPTEHVRMPPVPSPRHL